MQTAAVSSAILNCQEMVEHFGSHRYLLQPLQSANKEKITNVSSTNLVSRASGYQPLETYSASLHCRSLVQHPDQKHDMARHDATACAADGTIDAERFKGAFQSQRHVA